jgi:membrane protein implicated in regulation of membrane protease activity
MSRISRVLLWIGAVCFIIGALAFIVALINGFQIRGATTLEDEAYFTERYTINQLTGIVFVIISLALVGIGRYRAKKEEEKRRL